MDSTKPHGFFLASFLVLALFGDLTEACSCEAADLQTACCYSQLVMSAKFMGVSKDPESPSYASRNIYRIKPTKVIKGPKEIIDAQFLYTPSLDIYCGYEHRGPLRGEEYIFSGSFSDNRLRISLCSFAKPWDQLTAAEKKILSNDGPDTCSCPPL